MSRFKKQLQHVIIPVLMNARDTTCSIVVIRVKFFQNELMVEIYSKRLVRGIGKVLLTKCIKNTN